MRQMPYGQWVPFDGYRSVHRCGQTSQYQNPHNASRKLGRSQRRTVVRFVVEPAKVADIPAQNVKETVERDVEDKTWKGKIRHYLPHAIAVGVIALGFKVGFLPIALGLIIYSFFFL
jgi:hypothetical protein